MHEDTRKCALLTFPQIHREYGLGVRTLQREAARGSFPVYAAGTAWPRVLRVEFEDWLRSTRIPAGTGARIGAVLGEARPFGAGEEAVS